jgi:sodium/hydrogen exchanger 8
MATVARRLLLVALLQQHSEAIVPSGLKKHQQQHRKNVTAAPPSIIVRHGLIAVNGTFAAKQHALGSASAHSMAAPEPFLNNPVQQPPAEPPAQPAGQPPAGLPAEPPAPPPQPPPVGHEYLGTSEEFDEEIGGALEHGDTELSEEIIARWLVVPIAAALMLTFLLGNLLEKHEITWFPHSAVIMLVGALLGLVLKLTLGRTSFFQNNHLFVMICSTLLNLFFLPILIFESGWSLPKKDFASQLFHILDFACVGSLISFLIVGLLIYNTGGWLHGVQMPRTAFAFASLISATDPVATLATYSSLKVDPLLNIMVWGDSTFNDAVAIVLFKVLNSDYMLGISLHSVPNVGQLSLNIITGIVKIFCGSVLVGMLLGYLYILTLRIFEMHHAKRLMNLYLFCSCYMTFSIAESIEMSGIIATVTNGMFMSIYAKPHLSADGSLVADMFIKRIAVMADTAVFMLVGVCSVTLGPRGVVFGAWAMLFCLCGRAAAIFPIGFLTNAVKKHTFDYFWDLISRARGPAGSTEQAQDPASEPQAKGEKEGNLLSPQLLFMMWHAGLRGGIALVLCMELGPWVDQIETTCSRHTLQTATYFVIVVFLLVFGGSTETCLRKMKVPTGVTNPDPDRLYRDVPESRKQLLNRLNDVFVQHLVGKEKWEEYLKSDEQKEFGIDALREC